MALFRCTSDTTFLGAQATPAPFPGPERLKTNVNSSQNFARSGSHGAQIYVGNLYLGQINLSHIPNFAHIFVQLSIGNPLKRRVTNDKSLRKKSAEQVSASLTKFASSSTSKVWSVDQLQMGKSKGKIFNKPSFVGAIFFTFQLCIRGMI